MKHIYIFGNLSRGVPYRVGTYIDQLLRIKSPDITMHVVYLNANVPEVTVSRKEGIEHILFPSPVLVPHNNISTESYQTNIIRILHQHIDTQADNVFHLNYLDSLALAKSIKKYLNGKIVFTIHYSQSLFNLGGDVAKLHEIISTPKADNELPVYAFAREEIAMVKNIIDCVDQVISVAHHSFALNNNIYEIETGKNVVIHNALEDTATPLPAKIELRKELGICCTGKIIIFAGRLDEIKGLQCLLQALTILKKKSLDFHLLIAGRGEFDVVMSYAQDLYTNITFTGFLNKDRLYQLFSVADIGVVPSLYEEFGYVTLEMMMHQLPVIAYDTTGSAEIVDDGNTGLLAKIQFDQPKESIQDLADKIESLLACSKKCHQMGQTGRQRFLDYFSSEKFMEKMSDLYSSLWKKEDKIKRVSLSEQSSLAEI